MVRSHEFSYRLNFWPLNCKLEKGKEVRAPQINHVPDGNFSIPTKAIAYYRKYFITLFIDTFAPKSCQNVALGADSCRIRYAILQSKTILSHEGKLTNLNVYWKVFLTTTSYFRHYVVEQQIRKSGSRSNVNTAKKWTRNAAKPKHLNHLSLFERRKWTDF